MKKKKFNKKINVFPDNRTFQKHAYTRLFEQFFFTKYKKSEFSSDVADMYSIYIG